jgi:hypothetical protein
VRFLARASSTKIQRQARLLAEDADAHADAVDVAVQHARTVIPDCLALARRERGQVLNRIVDGLEENLHALTRLETPDNGRSITETLAQQRIIPGFSRYFAAGSTRSKGHPGRAIPLLGTFASRGRQRCLAGCPIRRDYAKYCLALCEAASGSCPRPSRTGWHGRRSDAWLDNKIAGLFVWLFQNLFHT